MRVNPKKTKLSDCLDSFLQAGAKGLNRLDALSQYNDLCLHSTVSKLANDYGIVFERKSEPHRDRTGKTTYLKRYRLIEPTAIERGRQLLDAWGRGGDSNE
ncbi:hypothetical protein PN836_017585 [Ningiella sp. W23]|uniref:hypothetical protein n=1 Tax=Ningiella sp. W23 TaxID=3023715 RepID=UPI003757EE75